MTEHKDHDHDRDANAELDFYYKQLQQHPESAPMGLKTRILAAASPRALTWQQRLSQYWYPTWRAVLTCLLPLAIGFGIGMNDPFTNNKNYEIDSLLFADSLTVLNQNDSYE